MVQNIQFWSTPSPISINGWAISQKNGSKLPGVTLKNIRTNFKMNQHHSKNSNVKKLKLNFEKLNFWLIFAQILIFYCPKVLSNASNKPCRLVSEYMSLHKKRLGGSVQLFFSLWIFNSLKISKKQPISLVFSPEVNFSHTQLPSIALKCYPTITSLPQHTKDGEKNGIHTR